MTFANASNIGLAPARADEPGVRHWFSRLFEHSTLGASFQDASGAWLDANPAFCRLIGVAREDLIGKNFLEITHPDDRERSQAQLHRLKSGEIAGFRFDKRYLHADGHEVWVRLDVSTLADAEGELEFILTQASDITAGRQIRAQLAENEARMRSIIRAMAEGLVVLDDEQRFVFANQRAREILEFDGSTLTALRLYDFAGKCLRPDGGVFPVEEFPAAITLATGQARREEQLGLRLADGVRWIEISTEPIVEPSGRVRAVVATFSDISQRIQAERALRESREQLSLALEGADLGLWDWQIDEENGEFTLSDSALRLLKYRPGEFAPEFRSIMALVHPDDRQDLRSGLDAHLSGAKPALEIDTRIQRKSGGYGWYQIRGRIVERDAADRPLRMTGILADIGPRKALEHKLHQLATTDELTGLYNRRSGNERLRDEIERFARTGRPFAFILFDIDHFKRINDSFGHEQGDAVLQRVAEALRNRARRVDIAARWGGEEFAVILPETSLVGARRFGQDVLRQMQAERLPDGRSVTASFGIVESSRAETASDLVRRADRLLYQAKANGRARIETE